MQTVSERLSQLKEKKNLSYSDIEKLSGIPKAALQRYFTFATVKIPFGRVERLAKVFDISPTTLMGWDENDDGSPSVRKEGIDMSMATGKGEEGEIVFHSINDFLCCTVNCTDKSGFNLPKGTMLLLKKGNKVSSGQLVLLSVDGAEHTLCKYIERQNKVIFVPVSLAADPFSFRKEELNNGRVRIEGIAVKSIALSDL